MLARGLRVILAMLAAAGAAAGAWLAARHGLPPWTAAFVAIWLVVGVPVLVAALSFVLAAPYRSTPPPALRIGPLAYVACVAREIVWFTVSYVLTQAVPGLFLARERAQSAQVPVLLVPGFMCNAGVWAWFARRLRKRGCVVYTVTLEPVFAEIDAYVEPLAKRIDDVLAQTRAAQLVLVGHSMGGLVSRAYVRQRGTAKIARIVTVGAPHHGSALAPLGHGQNARAMDPTADWLAAMAAFERPGFKVAVTSIFSYHDNFVVPQDSGVLAGAKNVPLAGLGHMSMIWSEQVAALVAEEIAAAGAQSSASTCSA